MKLEINKHIIGEASSTCPIILSIIFKRAETDLVQRGYSKSRIHGDLSYHIKEDYFILTIWYEQIN